MKNRDLIVYAGIGLGLYLLYRKFSGIVGAAVDTIAAPIAKGVVNFNPLSANGMIVFQDGGMIPFGGIATRWNGNNLLFDYGGKTFKLDSHDASGNYPATLIA